MRDEKVLASQPTSIATTPSLSARLLIAALAAGLLQNALNAFFPGLPGLMLYDDILVLLSLAASITTVTSRPFLPIYWLTWWLFLLTIGIFRSSIDSLETVVLFRQVALPAVLVTIGLGLDVGDWARIRRVVIWFGLTNATYMLFEVVGFRLVDPATLLTDNPTREYLGRAGLIRDGLPAYYHYYSFGTVITRLGGVVLNPPTAGLLTATTLVFLFWERRPFPLRRIWLGILPVLTLLTFSRGGLLLAVVGIIGPTLLLRVGRIATLALLVPSLLFAGYAVADHGSSGSHIDGLVAGLRSGFATPFGSGFGAVGNFLASKGLDSEGGESLVAIAVSAAGPGALFLILALLAFQTVQLARRPTELWEAAVAIGILAAAMFSESAGALNVTIGAWVATGVSLQYPLASAIHENYALSPRYSSQNATLAPREVAFRPRKQPR